MKKSVILIISTLSLIAIILIGLVFQRAEVYNVTVYVQEIVCSTIRIGDEYFAMKKNSQNIYVVDDPNRPDEPNAFLTLPYIEELTLDIIYEVLPYNATNQSVTFFGDPSSLVAQVDGETGRVVFLDEGTETFTIRANDNSNISARVRLRAKVQDPEADT